MTATPKQRAYLDFIRSYIALHRESPAESDMAAFFQVSPPSVHRMVLALEQRGLITREPGKARSIRLIADPHVDPSPNRSAPAPQPRPSGELTAPLDPEITRLVEALRDDLHFVTLGSCCGHGKEPAYVDLAVEGLEGLRFFVACTNIVDKLFENQALIGVTLNWSEQVVTSCDFEMFPDWIMLSLRIEGTGRRGAPSAVLLGRIADAYRSAAASSTFPRPRQSAHC